MPATETVFSLRTLEDLRNYLPDSPSGPRPPIHGDLVYVKCHTWEQDGGGGFFYFYDPDPQYFAPENRPDNDGTIIEDKIDGEPLKQGRWIRKYEGYINICFFGAFGYAFTDAGERIQKAIDFAAETALTNPDVGSETGCSTVYFPKGVYEIQNTIVLRTGVSLLGDSSQTVELRAGYRNNVDGWMIQMEEGRVEGCNIANFRFDGQCDPDNKNHDNRHKGCMMLRAVATLNQWGVFDGGMWNCTFRNITVLNFNGGGIFLMGGGVGDKVPYASPNQLSIFENVYVNRQKPETHSLLMNGEQGQISFINCGFGGRLYNRQYKDEQNPTIVTSFEALKGMNVAITNRGYVETAVISFINCTFQDAEYGVYIKFAESITMDTCWFENLDLSITAENNPDDGPSKGINVLNCRFANASGFGSLDCTNRNGLPPANYIAGRCITSVGSEVNVYNNYVTVTAIIDTPPPYPIGYVDPFINKAFILALDGNSGVRTSGNSYQDNRLGRTAGILQTFPITSHTIKLRDTKIGLIVGEATNPDIDTLDCSINAGEILSLRTSNEHPITFAEGKNIFLSGKGTVSLNYGDIATFLKLDGIGGVYPDLYQLISLFKSTTPA